MLLVLWYQRVRTNGLVCLDLSRPEELDLLRRYGPFITNARVWAHGDPLPVNETADSFHDLPRYTYRLDPAELERMRAALAKVGPPSSTLVPRRVRASKRQRHLAPRSTHLGHQGLHLHRPEADGRSPATHRIGSSMSAQSRVSKAPAWIQLSGIGPAITSVSPSRPHGGRRLVRSKTRSPFSQSFKPSSTGCAMAVLLLVSVQASSCGLATMLTSEGMIGPHPRRVISPTSPPGWAGCWRCRVGRRRQQPNMATLYAASNWMGLRVAYPAATSRH